MEKGGSSIDLIWGLPFFVSMKAVMVTPKNQTELRFITDLLRKLNITASTLTDEEVEDMGLLRLMNKADMAKTVSREEIIRKLKS